MTKATEGVKNQEADSRLALASEGMLTVQQAQAFLQVSRSALYSLMDMGRLPYAKIGRCRRVPVAALKAYAAGCLVGGSASN
jgi:excisionase family DNA binding protein